MLYFLKQTSLASRKLKIIASTHFSDESRFAKRGKVFIYDPGRASEENVESCSVNGPSIQINMAQSTNSADIAHALKVALEFIPESYKKERVTIQKELERFHRGFWNECVDSFDL